MRTERKLGAWLIAAGIVLVAAGLGIVGFNLYDEYRAGREASETTEALKSEIAAQQEPVDTVEEQLPDYVLDPDMEMPTTTVDGNEYIGVLEVPSLGLSLPVMSEWSYPGLRIAPCRYSGSAYGSGFTIAAHNYSTHFGPVRNLSAGAEVVFTDVEGNRFVYRVQSVEVLEPTDIEEMLSDEWDLTLFTCTTGGQARVAERCLKTADIH